MPDERPYDPSHVDASPTKDFFIFMLTRDIGLNRAIADLVDNCVDGARRLRSDNNFKDLYVRLRISSSEFRIADNCGGIPIDIARNYAFRFGRPSGMQPTTHSVGQFGVGMKRALFKIGAKFNIESKEEKSCFTLEENVNEWRLDPEWEFRFSTYSDNACTQQEDELGTVVTITDLHESVQSEFALDNFKNRLILELASAHQYSLGGGLSITLNEIPLTWRPTELLSSDELKPAYEEHTYPVTIDGAEYEVKIKIYVGIGLSSPNQAGWYIFCNGRLVLEADQTSRTAWGEGNGREIPKYHNQFARFRGYVFFDCDNAGALPWNTTKTDVDSDSPLYSTIRSRIITLMRPVLDFLNELDREKDQEDDRPLHIMVDSMQSTNIDTAPTRPIFQHTPRANPNTAPKSQGISYVKPKEEVDRVKESLGVKSNKDVGEKTFEYYMRMEC